MAVTFYRRLLQFLRQRQNSSLLTLRLCTTQETMGGKQLVALDILLYVLTF